MANPSGSRAEAAYARAVTAFQEGSLDAAKQFVNEALSADPGHPGARALRTRIEARLSAGTAGRGGHPQASPGRGAPRAPEATSVDPTILLDRAANRPPEYIEPTVMIQRDDWRREAPHPPSPAPTRRGAHSAPEPTVLIPSKKRAPAPAAADSGGFVQRVKDLAGGAPPAKRPPARGGTARQPGGFWTPTMRGAALTFGGLVVASLLVAVLVLLFRWMWPSGNTLTVERPTGGTITGAGLQCGTRGSDCTVTRPPDDTVTLQTTPDTGFVLSGFTGDCAPSGRVLMSQPRSCGATFGPVGSVDGGGSGRTMRTLTILRPTGGTIVGDGISCGSLNTICTATVPDGTAVTLNIQPDPGYQFEQFTGDCSAEGTVTMSASRTCGVSFGKPPVPIATDVRRPESRPTAPRGNAAGSVRGVDSQPPPGGRRGNADVPATSAQGGGQTVAPGQGAPAQAPPAGSTTAATPGLTGSVASAQSEAQKPPTPEITAEAHARKEIVQLIKNYCGAMETLQPNKLKELFPQIDVGTHRELFKQYKSLKCSVVGEPEFERLDASPAGFAQVKTEFKQQLEMKAGGAPKLQELIVTLRVSRLSNNSPWMIERMQAGLKPK